MSGLAVASDLASPRGGHRLAELERLEACTDGRIGDRHSRSTFGGRTAAISRTVQHGDHGKRDCRKHEKARPEFDHLEAAFLSCHNDEAGEAESTSW
jgi:hypothetical protein